MGILPVVHLIQLFIVELGTQLQDVVGDPEITLWSRPELKRHRPPDHHKPLPWLVNLWHFGAPGTRGRSEPASKPSWDAWWFLFPRAQYYSCKRMWSFGEGGEENYKYKYTLLSATKDVLKRNWSPRHSRCSRPADWLMAKNGLTGPQLSLLITQVRLLIP